MTGFRKSLAISAALHAGLLAATLIVLRAPSAHQTALLDSIPLELVDDISEDAQRAGEQRAERTETPQVREAPQPTPRPDPTPVPPPERPRPVDPSSAPEPPPPPAERQAEQPRAAPPIPTPPQRPPEPQQAARTEEPPDEDGMLRRIEEDRRQEQQRQQEEARRQEEQRRQEQRRQEQARREEQRRQEAAAAARRRQEQQRQEQQRQAQFDAQRVRDIINRQEGQQQPEARQGPTRTASLGNPRGTGQRLTQSQMALLAGMIRDQIAPCWSPPPGPQGGTRNVVRIELLMNRDGSFSARPRVMNASSDAGFRPLADSAVRAIMNCANRQGGKLNLPAEMYDVPNGWREIEFAFDPSQMS